MVGNQSYLKTATFSVRLSTYGSFYFASPLVGFWKPKHQETYLHLIALTYFRVPDIIKVHSPNSVSPVG